MLKEVKKVFTPRYGYIYANPEIYPKGNNYGEFINDVLYIAREKLLNKYDLSIPNNEILDGGLWQRSREYCPKMCRDFLEEMRREIIFWQQE